MQAPTSDVLDRTLWIRCGRHSGTAFSIEVGDRQYLVTAAHVLQEHGADTPIYRRVDRLWLPLDVDVVAADPDFVDAVILCPREQMTPSLPLPLGLDGFVLGQDLFILGYPFDVHQDPSDPDPIFMSTGSPLPMVKKGALAWLRKAPGPGRQTIFLDCYANEGFSGGPVAGFPGGQGQITVIGVVSHYVPEHKPVVDARGKTALSAEQNPGILVVVDIAHVVDAIHSAGSRGAVVRVRGM